MPRAGMRVGFIEPHLGRFGGIRRVVEFANRLVARGHEVTFFVPDDQVTIGCHWMECRATLAPIPEDTATGLDVVVFNHEPQWFLLDRFSGAKRIFYALHDGGLYDKEGSWEAMWAPVDLQLANSNWTADRLAAHTGVRPTVQLGGVNRQVFWPWGGEKRYPVLCSGVEKWWKGTDTIRAACARLGLPVEGYEGKDLEQPDLGREYDAARVFVVGSTFEGFCQPGLEALACGVPLVTTDNGGCREYAIDGETALVVEPGDDEAMATAIDRLLDDEVLAKQLAANGLDLVARDFDWEARTDQLAEVLDGVVAGTAAAPPPRRPPAPTQPQLSVVVLAWDNLLLTQRFVESVRRNTDVAYELIVVDNGSAREAADYAAVAGDTVILNPTNLGFARGMNQGLEASSGQWVAFCNNDTVLPPAWASTLLETAVAHPGAGLVVPAITAANNPITVRTEPGTEVEVLDPFCAPPAAVIYLAPADVVRDLGAWGEEYEIASGEDVDLAFKVWVNDLDIVYDQRVLVEHISKGTASRLDDWKELWARNRRRFLDKWSGDAAVPQLATCPPERHRRNRATAAAVASWMDRYFSLRDRIAAAGLSSDGRDPLAEPTASGWVEALAANRTAADDARLVRDPAGRVFLLEGHSRRVVGSGLIAAALEAAMGAITPVAADELDRYEDGPPVALLTTSTGAPVIIAGGRRLGVWGVPAPTPAPDRIRLLPAGEPLDIAAANVSRFELDRIEPSRGGSTAPVRRAVRRLRRTLRPSS